MSSREGSTSTSTSRKKSKWDDDDDDEPRRAPRPPKKAKKSTLSGVALSTSQSPAPSPRREHPIGGAPGPSTAPRPDASPQRPTEVSSAVATERPAGSSGGGEGHAERGSRRRRIRDLHPPITGCRSVYCYERLNHIEEGSYGVVFRARDKETGDIVALKKIKMDQEKNGFPITSLREIHTLMIARHENIVRVREIVVGDTLTQIFIVMDFIEHDLKTLLATMRTPFLASEIKTILLQLLSATALCHENWIVHRDLKTSNLLMNNRGQIKVADFGLARTYSDPLGNMTPLVVTLWYRAPELLLGIKEYTTAIDMWSVGCIFGELILKEPLFAGKGEIEQVGKIFKVLGRPTDDVWPGFSRLPNAASFNTSSIQPYSTLRQKFRFVTEAGLDLMNRLLTYDPERRITAEEALKHPYFRVKIDSPPAPIRGAGGGAAQYDLIL